MERMHIPLDAQAVGTMVCPQCGTQRVVNVRQQCPQILARVGEKSATITCRCGAVVQVQFDFRRHPRKAVQLRGTFVAPQTCTTLSDIVIVSLSVQGLGCVLARNLCLQRDAIYTTSFHLDDGEQSRIHEPVIIRRLQGRMVGAEFYPPEQYHYALDFYMDGAHLLPPSRPAPRSRLATPRRSPRRSPRPVPLAG